MFIRNACGTEADQRRSRGTEPDGWRVLQFMRSCPGRLKRTIVLTANKYDPRVAQAIQEYGVAHAFKPFVLTDLIDKACVLLAKVEYTAAA